MTLATTKHSLEQWHEMIKTRDLTNLNDLLAEDVVFRSPVAYKPYEGKHVVLFILTNVIQVFQDFTYHREFYTEDGENVVLEFSANVSGKSLKGIDMIRFNEQGKIIDFEVMIRPMSGLAALAEKMGARFAQYQANA
ncbi:nuclear transport factor 2 family protein [Acinetobacter venetianus]|uniref:nuclear transport factor 2 family protein n=1 Tax=Acinetobacter venetianus TaxID=52133 RepID=UPI00037F435C|nr:nuclear transport factor 2 family protein [Acinetobacter venetianus]MCR4530591.1 nuclear transport factor 2 family protein [Acinetobacter venetianus]MDA0697310.1 nuclear transport factor 2 family protein [Pseudomonadota bacterium]MDA1254642.1 nuclear transport factor 2 family protein [Pseudomonadota bacterium]